MKKDKAFKHFQIIEGGIVFDFVSEPEGGYTVSVPTLPGCISYGKTFEEALAMIKDAMEGYLAVAKEEGLFIPYEFEEKSKSRLSSQVIISP